MMKHTILLQTIGISTQSINANELHHLIHMRHVIVIQLESGDGKVSNIL